MLSVQQLFLIWLFFIQRGIFSTRIHNHQQKDRQLGSYIIMLVIIAQGGSSNNVQTFDESERNI